MISFDVFDTLITRNTATPKGVFAIMQDKLESMPEFGDIDSYVRANFYQLRVHAEELARVSFCIREVQELELGQIYDCLEMTGRLTLADKERLMRLEYETEFACSLPISQNIETVKELLDRGEKVVLISDMYLESNFIRKLLVKADKRLGDIPLYVSVDYKRNKWYGQLYAIVKETEGAEYSDWIHYGDNDIADIEAAQRLGITTHKVKVEPLMVHELNFLEHYEDDAEFQLCIGIARNTRMCGKSSDAFRVGSSIGAAILYPYVDWVLESSIKKGIKRLYFIARDGYLLKKIADIIIEQKAYDITTSYLYGSRKAWRMASIHNGIKSVDDFIWWSNIYRINNFQEFADIFEITADDMKGFFPDTFAENEWKMKPIILDYCRKQIHENKKFIEFLCEKHREKRSKATGYLKQEVDVCDEHFAFVDLGGTGFTQECLADLMVDVYDGKIQTYFFKLDRYRENTKCIFYDFFPSFINHNIVLEMLARAPHGQTDGYEIAADGRYVPIMNKEGEALLSHGFNDYAEGLTEFVKSYASHRISLRAVDTFLQYVIATPDRLILSFIGDMPTSEIGRGEIGSVFAPKLSDEQIESIFLGLQENESIERYYTGTYLEYSMLRCSAKQLRKIDFCRKNYNSPYGQEYRRKYKKLEKSEGNYPLEALCSKIVLYAAGKMGQKWYEKISDYGNSQIVCWVDKNYEQYQKQGMPVEAPATIIGLEYDMVIVGVLERDRYLEIKDYLQELGVAEKKIMWFNLRISNYGGIVDSHSRAFRE